MSAPHHRFPVIEPLHPLQQKILSAMTPQQKYDLLRALYAEARVWKTAGVRAQHPDWPEEQVEDEVRRIFLYGCT
jgi:hypothetical protein